MKKYMIAIAAMAAAVSVLAQGTVQFVNNGTGLRAPVYGLEVPNDTVSKLGNTTAGIVAGTQTYTGALLTGSGWTAQLWGAAGAGALESSLQPAAALNTFRTGSAAGILASGVVATFGNISADANTGTLQLRVWNNLGGTITTWAAAETAWNSGLIAAGKSDLFTATAGFGGGTLPTPLPIGLTSFNVYMIPEPTTFALLGLGALGMLIFRRK